jgi:hypothetical protein
MFLSAAAKRPFAKEASAKGILIHTSVSINHLPKLSILKNIEPLKRWKSGLLS